MSSVLQDLLSPDLKLLSSAETRTLALLCISSSSILAEERLTKNEWTVFMTLVHNHPHYAPYEVLLSNLTSLSPDICRKRIHEAQQKSAKAMKQELKPVYRAISGLRGKLQIVYEPLKVSLVRDAGYMLFDSPNLDEDEP